MTATDYISGQDPARRKVLSDIHSIILKEDSTVAAEVGLMMGKEMILYKERGYFKYGLSSVKSYMSMHVMPIYGGSPLHARYQKLLPQAEFQKGCINFRNEAEVPPDVLQRLFADCANVSIAALLEKRTRKK
ncbi:MAG TPA: hypothetical protein VGQ51_17250 [Puia sp.]|jgi:hypothetical protein|nr:hypothetical protein [Puia sp.]